MPIEFITKDPEVKLSLEIAQYLMSACTKAECDCSKCDLTTGYKINSAGGETYRCGPGTALESFLKKKMKKGKVPVTEEDLCNLNIHSINYTGKETAETFRNIADNITIRALTQ